MGNELKVGGNWGMDGWEECGVTLLGLYVSVSTETQNVMLSGAEASLLRK